MGERIPQKPLTFIVIEDGFCSREMEEDNAEIMEKFQKLGIVKKFEIKSFDEEENEFKCIFFFNFLKILMME